MKSFALYKYHSYLVPLYVKYVSQRIQFFYRMSPKLKKFLTSFIVLTFQFGFIVESLHFIYLLNFSNRETITFQKYVFAKKFQTTEKKTFLFLAKMKRKNLSRNLFFLHQVVVYVWPDKIYNARHYCEVRGSVV
jgi:hypothetical protein